MPYTIVDPVIQSWASANSLVLFDTFAGQPRRFCYMSSPAGETFQISVDPPDNDLVKVHIVAIETLDDMEAHLEWRVAIPELRAALDTALDTVESCLWRRTPMKA